MERCKAQIEIYETKTNKMNLAPVLPYITGGLILDPQNKRGIPVLIKNSININYGRNTQKEEDISMTIHINIK